MTQPSGRPTAAIVEDHVLVRESLAQLLTGRCGVHVVAATADLAEVATLVPPPELVLLDLNLGGRSADPAAVEGLVGRGCQVLVVSAMESPRQVAAMLAAGVAGFVAKQDSTEELVAAVLAVVGGQRWTSPELAAVLAADRSRPALSGQEEQALLLYASGLKMAAVARRMGVSYETAKSYLDRVRDKYAALGRDVRTKTELYAAAVEDGYVEP